MKQNVIQLYHSSKFIESVIKFDNDLWFGDYGKGYYCTLDYEVAKQVTSRFDKNYFLTTFELDTANLRTLDFYKEEFSVLNWIATVAKYRLRRFIKTENTAAIDYLIKNFAINVEDYDVVIGARTDNSNLDFIQSFLRNGMSYSILKKHLGLDEKDKVFVVVNAKILENLSFVKREVIDASLHYQKYLNKDLRMRTKLKMELKQNIFEKDVLFLNDIFNGGIKADDPRL